MDFLAKTTDAVTESEIRHAETVRELASAGRNVPLILLP